MKYILSHPRLTISSRVLAQKLSELTGERIIVRTLPSDNEGLIIRYGTSSHASIGSTNYNSPEMIRLAGSKLRLSEFLRDKEFSHVEINDSDDDVYPQIYEYPICIRKELNRGGGIGIEIHETPEEPFTDGDYWSKWYNFQFELGVHILGGEIVKVFKKVREEELESEKYPIRNTQRGYKFSLRENWKERYRGLDNFVKKLYELVPIQFARLDVGYDRDSGGYRLIEINSAPDLSQNQNTLNLYANFLKEKIFGG
jgi:hypothetical protein